MEGVDAAICVGDKVMLLIAEARLSPVPADGDRTWEGEWGWGR